MRLDLVLPNEGAYMLEAVNAAPLFEDMGWSGLWLSDHLLGIPEDHLHKPEWLELMVTMAHIAARTSRIRIGSGIAVLPHRDPVLTARMIASLDQLSGGRIDFGVGVGWLRREFEALGAGSRYDDRGRWSNEALDVILACWRGGEVSFDGEFITVPPVTFEPGPVQPGGRVPLWIGTLATKGPPLDRVARYADYWHPSEADTKGNKLTPEIFRDAGDRLDERAGRRIPRTLRLKCNGDPVEKVEMLHAFAEAGCVQAACSFISGAADFPSFARAAEAFYKAAESLRG